MPSNTVEMRGLSTFITDLRNCRSTDQEEKRVNKELGHIRQKFKSGNLSGYDRKKYVCKLLYMFILGYRIDFGFVEAVNLIASSKFKEKQMGYLAVTLFMNESMEAIHLVINTFKKDLEVEHEALNCLVLHAIANLGGALMADSLASDILKKVTTTSSSFVQKKAMLCLLKLYRKAPQVVFPSHSSSEWIVPLYRLIQHQQQPSTRLDVVLVVCTLCIELVKEHPRTLFTNFIPELLQWLYKLIFHQSIQEKEIYYRVPVPWLLIKLFILLRTLAPTLPNILSFQSTLMTEGLNPLTLVDQLFLSLMDQAKEAFQKKNMQHVNAITAVLYECIQVMMLWNPESSHFIPFISFIANHMAPKSMNLKYVAMELYRTLLSLRVYSKEIRAQEAFIRQVCQDKDISVRHQAMDVFYELCDAELGPLVIRTFLDQLKQQLEPEIQQVVVLKTATLAEKFIPHIDTYFTTMCELMLNAGDTGHPLWYAVVNKVLNEPQKSLSQAIHLAYQTLSTTKNELIMQVCVYLIGEHIQLLSMISLEDLVQVILKAFHQSSDAIKPLFLMTFFKCMAHFPSLTSTFSLVFQQFATHMDIELQERAYFYWMLVPCSPNILKALCETLPPFLPNTIESTSTTSPSSSSSSASSSSSPSSMFPSNLSSPLELNPLSNPLLLQSGTSVKMIDAFTSKSMFALFYFLKEGVLANTPEFQLGAQVRVSSFPGQLDCMLYVGNHSKHQSLELTFSVQNKPEGMEMHVQPSMLSISPSVQERVLISMLFQTCPLSSPVYLMCSNPFVHYQIRLPTFFMFFAEPFHFDSSSSSSLSSSSSSSSFHYTWNTLSIQSTSNLNWVPLDQLHSQVQVLKIASQFSTEGSLNLAAHIRLPSFQCLSLAQCKLTDKKCQVEIRSTHSNVVPYFLEAIEAAIHQCNGVGDQNSALLGLF